MRFELAPSILSADMGNMREVVQEMLDAGCERIHLDVMDGQFVPPITFGSEFVRSIADKRGFFEAHLMTLTPEAHFDAFIDAGCNGIIFHYEATSHPHRLLQALRDRGVQAGIAINPGTPAHVLDSLSGLAELVLVMTVNPGWGGQKFIDDCLPKVAYLRERFTDIDIEVDGGIDDSTIARARAAGANVFVSGAYMVRQRSIALAADQLRKACG